MLSMKSPSEELGSRAAMYSIMLKSFKYWRASYHKSYWFIAHLHNHLTVLTAACQPGEASEGLNPWSILSL